MVGKVNWKNRGIYCERKLKFNLKLSGWLTIFWQKKLSGVKLLKLTKQTLGIMSWGKPASKAEPAKLCYSNNF